jgi:hypothetical protein
MDRKREVAYRGRWRHAVVDANAARRVAKGFSEARWRRQVRLSLVVKRVSLDWFFPKHKPSALACGARQRARGLGMAASPASGASPRTELALVVAGSGAADAGGEGGNLGAARAARKLAESEVRALENRILLLRKEEDKALLRISQTKKRAEEVLRLREENLARKKELAQHRLESSVAPADPEVVRRRFVEKELAKAARRKQVKAQHECKRADANEFRSEKKRFEETCSSSAIACARRRAPRRRRFEPSARRRSHVHS